MVRINRDGGVYDKESSSRIGKSEMKELDLLGPRPQKGCPGQEMEKLVEMTTKTK